MLADSPEFFVARSNTASDVVLFALAVTVVPPTVLVLVEVALMRLPRVRRGVHLVFVGLLGAGIAVQVVKSVVSVGSAATIALSLGMGAVLAVAYARAAPVRMALGVLGPLPVVFLLAFLFFSPVSDVVFPKEARASEARAEGASSTPVVLVVFDELSGQTLMNDRLSIDRTRYPNFWRLSRRATWYRNATTVADFTSEAVPALLTGSRPEKGQLPTAADHPDNLFASLRDRYSFNVEEPITHLCPADVCGDDEPQSAGRRLWDLASDLSIVALHRLAPEGLEDRLPAVDETFSGFGGVAAADAAQDDLDRRGQSFTRFLARVGRRSSRPLAGRPAHRVSAPPVAIPTVGTSVHHLVRHARPAHQPVVVGPEARPSGRAALPAAARLCGSPARAPHPPNPGDRVV